MRNIRFSGSELTFSRAGELMRVTSPAPGTLRVEAFPGCRAFSEDFTLIPAECPIRVLERERETRISSGGLTLRLEENAKLTFFEGERILLEEKPELTFNTGFRHYENEASGLWSIRTTFEGREGERFYGMGHEASGAFDLKGCSFDLRHVNAKCTVPFVYSSLGYGFLWNNPALGNVELSRNRTRWSVDAAKKMDYVVLSGSPKEVSSLLADLTGHAPVLPEWAAGFWQSRLRYETQEELLAVAHRYREEGIPLSVIVADYFHWTEQGDYRFDPRYWPDIKAMTEELHRMGVKLVVSMWPTINQASENYTEMKERNLLIRTSRGSDRVFDFYGWQAEIDPTNPETREYVFGKLKENYLDNGVDQLWFDEAEPEIHPEHFDNLLLHAGRGDEVGLIYPYYYAKMVWDGFQKMGKEAVTLTRCAYLGSQKYGALVWSGDIPSTFRSLSDQVKAGLNMAMCGIPWWNTDIGGFYGADIESEDFRELIVRWFQFGVFSPVMRLHGSRVKHGRKTDIIEPSGDPNEIWSFGEENFALLKDLILLRLRLRPYILDAMKEASEKGYPVMRPMFFEYPEDETAYTTGGQYMFGPDILFAPVTEKGARSKTVYLPEGEWILTRDGREYAPGWHEIPAELPEFVAFVKKGAEVLKAF